MPVLSPYQCPKCGWWANDDQPQALVERTDPVRNDAHSEQFGVEALDWEETWKCPNDGTVFTFRNSNC